MGHCRSELLVGQSSMSLLRQSLKTRFSTLIPSNKSASFLLPFLNSDLRTLNSEYLGVEMHHLQRALPFMTMHQSCKDRDDFFRPASITLQAQLTDSQYNILQLPPTFALSLVLQSNAPCPPRDRKTRYRTTHPLQRHQHQPPPQKHLIQSSIRDKSG